MEEPINTEFKRTEKGTFAPGTAPGPGRPPGKTMKEFAREFYLNLSVEEKIEYIKKLEEKRPGFAWEMGEGKAKQDLDLKGEMVSKIITLDE